VQHEEKGYGNDVNKKKRKKKKRKQLTNKHMKEPSNQPAISQQANKPTN